MTIKFSLLVSLTLVVSSCTSNKTCDCVSEQAQKMKLARLSSYPDSTIFLKSSNACKTESFKHLFKSQEGKNEIEAKFKECSSYEDFIEEQELMVNYYSRPIKDIDITFDDLKHILDSLMNK